MVGADGTYTAGGETDGVQVAEHTDTAVWFRFHGSEHTFPVFVSEWPHVAHAIDFPESSYGPRFANIADR